MVSALDTALLRQNAAAEAQARAETEILPDELFWHIIVESLPRSSFIYNAKSAFIFETGTVENQATRFRQ
jgi:hypothetical protein